MRARCGVANILNRTPMRKFQIGDGSACTFASKVMDRIRHYLFRGRKQ